MLDFDLFRRVVDEVGPTLGRIDFFNYGEAFLHKRAIEMCEYIKTHFPHIYLYTSTNGLAFTEAQARRLVHSGIDEVTFSIDGATPGQLRAIPPAGPPRRGAGQPAGHGRREAPVRPRPAVPELALHPLQVERQRRGDEPGAADSRPRSAWTGCAGRSPTIPRTPSRGASCRGRADLEAIRRETWDDNNLGNAIPGATPARADRRAHRSCPDCRSSRRAGRPLDGPDAGAQPVRRVPSPPTATYGRRLVRLGAQLCAPDGALINRDFARAGPAAAASTAALAADVAVQLPPLAEPGATRSSSIW